MFYLLNGTTPEAFRNPTRVVYASNVFIERSRNRNDIEVTTDREKCSRLINFLGGGDSAVSICHSKNEETWNVFMLSAHDL
jgi:hypothetical protein